MATTISMMNSLDVRSVCMCGEGLVNNNKCARMWSENSNHNNIKLNNQQKSGNRWCSGTSDGQSWSRMEVFQRGGLRRLKWRLWFEESVWTWWGGWGNMLLFFENRHSTAPQWDSSGNRLAAADAVKQSRLYRYTLEAPGYGVILM